MKVAEIVATFPPHHGGMGYVCYHNARQLALRGHDVTVFTLDHGASSRQPLQFPVPVVRLPAPLKLGDGGLLPQLFFRTGSFDVIHLHYPFYGGAEYVYLASRLRGQPFLMTYHMDVFGTTLLKRMIIGSYERLFMKRIVREASRIAALSEQHLRSSKIAGCVDWRKVVELPNGVDATMFCPRGKDAALVEQYGLAGKTVVLFVGNLQPFKGLHLLIDAVAALRDRNVVLLIVGGGYGEKEFRRQVAERRIEKQVIFAGPRSPDADLPRYYNLGDFLVLASTHSESFGLVVLEAMASGIPVIVSDLPGPSRLVTPGIDGLIARAGNLADLRDKIGELVQKGDGRSAMGMEGRKKVLALYDWNAVGGRLEKILQDLVRN